MRIAVGAGLSWQRRGRIAVWLGTVSEMERGQLLAGAGSGTFSALR